MTLLKIDNPEIVLPTPAPVEAEPDPGIEHVPPKGVVTSVTSTDPRIVVSPNTGDVVEHMDLTLHTGNSGTLTIDQTDPTNPVLTATGGGGGGGPFADYNTTTNIWSGDTTIANRFYILVQGTYAMATPINMTDGMETDFVFQQNSTGGYSVTLPSNMKFPIGTSGTVDTSPNTITWTKCVYADDIGQYICTPLESYSGMGYSGAYLVLYPSLTMGTPGLSGNAAQGVNYFGDTPPYGEPNGANSYPSGAPYSGIYPVIDLMNPVSGSYGSISNPFLLPNTAFNLLGGVNALSGTFSGTLGVSLSGSLPSDYALIFTGPQAFVISFPHHDSPDYLNTNSPNNIAGYSSMDFDIYLTLNGSGIGAPMRGRFDTLAGTPFLDGSIGVEYQFGGTNLTGNVPTSNTLEAMVYWNNNYQYLDGSYYTFTWAAPNSWPNQPLIVLPTFTVGVDTQATWAVSIGLCPPNTLWNPHGDIIWIITKNNPSDPDLPTLNVVPFDDANSTDGTSPWNNADLLGQDGGGADWIWMLQPDMTATWSDTTSTSGYNLAPTFDGVNPIDGIVYPLQVVDRNQPPF